MTGYSGLLFAGERRKLAEVVLAVSVKLSTVEAQGEAVFLEPRFEHAFSGRGREVSVRCNPDRGGHAVFPGCGKASAPVAPLIRDPVRVPVVLRGGEH